jgi:hypothetical protein
MKEKTKRRATIIPFIVFAYFIQVFMLLYLMLYNRNISHITIAIFFTIIVALIPIFIFFVDNLKAQIFSLIIFAIYSGTLSSQIGSTFGYAGTSTLVWINLNGFDLLVLNFIWPVLGSIIFVISIRLVIFLMYMRFWNRDFRKGYLKHPVSFSFKKFINRLTMIVLFTFAISEYILQYIDIRYFTLVEELYTYQAFGPLYGFDWPHTRLFSLILPFSAAVFSAGWTIKDLGLMHYDIKKEGLYEIEPVHRHYDSLFKGFVEISLLLYLLRISGIFTLFSPEYYEISAYAGYNIWLAIISNAFTVPYIIFQFVTIGVLIIPAYMIYFYLNKKYEETYFQKILKEDYSVKKNDREKIQPDIYYPLVYEKAKEYGRKELSQQEEDNKTFKKYIIIVILVLACLGLSVLFGGLADYFRYIS